MRRGDVFWIVLPEGGRRPVCVLTREQALPLLSSVLVAPITRTVRGLPVEVPVDEADGLPTACVVNLDNVQPVAARLLAGPITTLSGARMDEVCRALTYAVGC